MKNTKEKILATALTLFNKFGYAHVTIRMIALELDMSPGNLNYHFKTREDILEALYFEMVEAFDSRIDDLGKQEITLPGVQQDIYLSLKRMVAYRFFWTDLYSLLRASEVIKSHFEAVYQRRFDGYTYLLNHLFEKGLLHAFEFPAERQLLIERMIGFSNTWLYNSRIYAIQPDDGFIQHQANSLLAMLYPYFTAQGKAALPLFKEE